jgi:hypothetical protein
MMIVDWDKESPDCMPWVEWAIMGGIVIGATFFAVLAVALIFWT